MNRMFNSTKCSCDFLADCKLSSMGDMSQYHKESRDFSFNRLCMIQIANSNLLMSCLGEAKYFIHLRKVVETIRKFISELELSTVIHSYILDNATFLVAAEPETTPEFFKTSMNSLYKNLQKLMPLRTDIPILFRFSVITNCHRMLERAIEGLAAKQNAQKSFIICDDNGTDSEATKRELHMLGVIQQALQSNGVVPYYQGLYDNHRGGINKYESLMRIVDESGAVYLPSDFMEIAKKHHIYAGLSKAMIKQVLKDSEDTPFAVSINLSAEDINSADFRSFIFKQLEHRLSKELLVFEILEDEAFEETDILNEFVNNAKRFGAKIAIDDFGSGYSNLLEVTQITPEYLKIDGDIVLKINDSPGSRAVFESVLYLAQKIGTKTVAEHVESLELQRAMEQYGVDFSQGFCISKPLPMSQLQAILEKNKEVVI